MPHYNLDMSQEQSINKIPNGIYTCIIDSCDLISKDESKSGKPYFKWELTVDNGGYIGEKLRVYTTAIKGKRWLLKQALESLGVQAGDGHKYNFDTSTFIGKLITVFVVQKDEEYDGKIITKSQVTTFRPYENQKTETSANGKKDDTPEF